jgi:branched-chain amino acid transport system permease protein
MLLQLIASGVSNGCLYALMALGMTILLRTTTLINFSQGEFAMAAAYIAFIAIEFGIPYGIAVLISFVALFSIGIAVERGLIRPLEGRPHLTLTLMIVALSFLMKGVARYFYGRDVLRFPSLIEGDPIEIGEVVFFPQDLFLIGASIVTVIVFFLIFERTRAGKIMQAAAQTPRGAALVGINVPKFQGAMWGFVAIIGALTGILIAPITLLYPDMGAKILIKGLAAMTLGGFGSLSGGVLGGFALGILENLAGGYIASSLTEVTAFIVIIIVLLLKPGGFFGEWKPTHV